MPALTVGDLVTVIPASVRDDRGIFQPTKARTYRLILRGELTGRIEAADGRQLTVNIEALRRAEQ